MNLSTVRTSKKYGKHQAAGIRSGTLLQDISITQDSQLSHEMSAQLNEHGFVTDTLQDASNKYSNYIEYSYVRGFLSSSQLHNPYILELSCSCTYSRKQE